MSVTFDPEVIYKNAFYSIRSQQLYKKEIVQFCNILQKEISLIAKYNIKYKYINFEFDKSTLASFYENYFGLISEIGEKIYSTKLIEDKEINELNNDYDENIKNALDNTRNEFCILKSE